MNRQNYVESHLPNNLIQNVLLIIEIKEVHDKAKKAHKKTATPQPKILKNIDVKKLNHNFHQQHVLASAQIKES